MTDTQHRDVYRVWHKFPGFDTEYAIYVYAVSKRDARARGEEKIRKMSRPGQQFEIIRTEKR